MQRTPVSVTKWRNFYGRNKGKALRRSQALYIKEDLPPLVPAGIALNENPTREPIVLSDLFGDDREVWLEIGFGGGEHLVHQAQQNPDVGFIGCEPYVNGVAMVLGKMRNTGINTIKLYPGDARDLLDVLPEYSIGRAFLLYPDPWPKRRHHRRRFVTQQNLVSLIKALKSGAYLRIATDIEDYVRQALEELLKFPDMEWVANSIDDWRKPWEDWISTRYEQKAVRAGRTSYYLTFRKL